MEAPNCRLCKKRHYGPCNTFSVREGFAPAADDIVPAKKRRWVKPVLKRYVRVSLTGGFDRVKYQREYMRKRRLRG